MTGAWSGCFLQLACGFIVLYPLLASMFWITASIFFLARWERPARRPARKGPFVSVVIYARQHAASLDRVLAAACSLDYRGYEVIVLDDAADAQTISRVAPFVQSGQVRLISKAVAEGRAMAFNDALPCVNGEIVLLLDGDVTLSPGVLKEMLPHFEVPRVAAVTGNIRIWQPHTWLERFQSLECSAIYSLTGRGQRVLGRGYVLPGSLIACRKVALLEIGCFNPRVISTEMDATWRLQRRSWDLRFEPRAIAWRPAAAARTLLLQHLDAAVALLQMLGRHADILRDRRYRRMWPLFAGTCLSFLWAMTSWGMAVYGVAQVMGGDRLLPVAHLPGPWAMAMVTSLMVQAGMGLWADRRYDPCQRGNGYHLILYPALYWLVVAGTLAAALPVCWLLHLLNRSPSPPGRQ